MPDSKIYLNVPFAQKDAAKALGARWDAANRKWYVPAGKDITLFAQWQAQSGTMESLTTAASKPKARAASIKHSPSTNNVGAGVITHPADEDFVAYNGDEQPWD